MKMSSNVHLPLGISFFTFQAISYLIDIYRKEAKVEKNIFNLALYISMFPQLVAGPIVRFKTVAEQIHHRVINIEQAVIGIKIFIIGLAQKVLLANSFADPADAIFSLSEATLTTATAWLGSICYSFQIYFDFAGYSNMAIGLGLIMGFTFPKNFNYPYISQSITEFWRRWHISLSTWFRDYLYIPLGGNRKSNIRTYINLMTIFVLCGLWHGAAWTFIIWGVYHGFFLIVERLKLNQFLATVWRPIRHIYTLIVVIVGWVIFRAENFEHLIYFLKSMFAIDSGVSLIYTFLSYISNSLISALILGCLFSSPLYTFFEKFIKLNNVNLSLTLRFISITIIYELFYIFLFLCSIMLSASGSYNPFIYFRF
jgi:alginate O-acetyltransferase complex protein AlgI